MGDGVENMAESDGVGIFKSDKLLLSCRPPLLLLKSNLDPLDGKTPPLPHPPVSFLMPKLPSPPCIRRLKAVDVVPLDSWTGSATVAGCSAIASLPLAERFRAGEVMAVDGRVIGILRSTAVVAAAAAAIASGAVCFDE
jgi:hypothetical protein